MASHDTRNIEDAILDMVYGREELTLQDSRDLDISVLPLFAKQLSSDLPMETLERFETILKKVLRAVSRGKLSGETARSVAQFQKEIGLLCKYKSYAVKCASPLGYSIFLQNRGAGFSFQRHIAHKTEVFHIIDVMPGGYVFICDFKEWEQCYDREAFAAWLAGREDERYERFRYQPQPGDVFTINELGVVHTVVGCVLEEFATVSTDMVVRLHDQNAGSPIPSYFNRNFVRQQLAKVVLPKTSRSVTISPRGARIEEIARQEIRGGYMTPLARTAIHASHYEIIPDKESELFKDNERASSIYVAEGSGQLIVAYGVETRQTDPPSIPISAGDLLMVPAGIHYGFVNRGSVPLKISEQRISLDVAFH